MRYADRYCTYTEIREGNEHYYIFTGKCVITGNSISVKIPAKGLYEYRKGALIQNAFPELSKDDREFLISGISGPAFANLFDCTDPNLV